MKSDRSVVVLHYFGLGRTIGFQAAVSDTTGGKHPESSHQVSAEYSNTDKTSVWSIQSLVSSVRRLSLHMRCRDVISAQARSVQSLFT